MSGRSPEARALFAGEQPECRDIDISVPTDILDLEHESQLCYIQCMSERQYADWIYRPDGFVSMVIGCKPKNCATAQFKVYDDEVVFVSDYNYDFTVSVFYRCSVERTAEIEAQGMQAMKNNKTSLYACCVPEDPKKRNLVGAIVGGTVGGLAALACVGVLVWMIVAKKACFASKAGRYTSLSVVY